jgi:hypothetical protein
MADTDPVSRQVLASRSTVAVCTIAVALIAGGCGQTATMSPAVAAASKRCLSFGPTSRATQIGQRPSPVGVSSCSVADVRQILGLVERLRAAVRGNGTVCSLLTPNYRSSAQRWQAQWPGYPSCDAAVLKVGGSMNPKLQFAQPVARIRLSNRNGRADAVITFSKATATSLPADPRTQPINLSIARTSDGTWQIEQIGYQF